MERMDIDPRHLRHLLALHRHGTFVKAARSLNLSQPALSVSIARLEDVVGRPLVERAPQGARLTTAGLGLVRHALAVENALGAAQAEMRLGAAGVEGPLRLGGSPLAVVSIIPEVLARLITDGPAFRAEVREAADDALLNSLLSEELDLAISGPDFGATHPGIEAVPLFRTRLVAVMRPGNPLACQAEIDLADLGMALWVLPPRTKGSFRTYVEAQFLSRGLDLPAAMVEADPFAAIAELVRRTDAVTLLSDQIVHLDLVEGRLVSRPLRDAPPPRMFYLRRLAGRPASPLAERFQTVAQVVATTFDRD
jgi:molybdate transport repressor ModE-like protein